jgi:hypothetical protein
LFTLTVIALTALGTWASDTPQPAGEKIEAAHQTAIYTVPNLDKALSKNLVKSLAEVKGILAAKPETDSGIVSVTFETAVTDAKQIHEALSKLAPEAKLDKVVPADARAAGAGCGKCPHAKTCTKKKS